MLASDRRIIAPTAPARRACEDRGRERARREPSPHAWIRRSCPPTRDRGLLPWSWAVARLRDAHDYWLATTWPDGGPHVMPVWGVWHDDAMWCSSSLGSRKARNLEHDSRCVLTTDDAQEPGDRRGRGTSACSHPSCSLCSTTRSTRSTGRTTPSSSTTPRRTECGTSRPIRVFGLDGDDFTGSPTRWELG